MASSPPAGVVLVVLVALVVTSLSGCNGLAKSLTLEDEFQCDMKDLEDKWESASAEISMPKSCCFALRSYITDRHHLYPKEAVEHRGDVTKEVVEDAKDRPATKSISEADADDALKTKAKKDQESLDTDSKLEQKTESNTNGLLEEETQPPDETHLDKLNKQSLPAPEKELIKQDEMTKIWEAFDESFCSAQCPSMVHNAELEEATTKLCSEASKSLLQESSTTLAPPAKLGIVQSSTDGTSVADGTPDPGTSLVKLLEGELSMRDQIQPEIMWQAFVEERLIAPVSRQQLVSETSELWEGIASVEPRRINV